MPQDFLLTVGQTKKERGPFDPKPLLWEKPGWLLWTAAADDQAAEEARFDTLDVGWGSGVSGFRG